MNRNEFAQWCGEKVRLLDGATGSNLQKAGMPSNVCPEKWISAHPDILLHLQHSYIEAGSEILLAPTFGANRLKLKSYGLEAETAALNRSLVALSKEAAAGKALVAGDITMTGVSVAPLGTLKMEELVEVYAEQARFLAEAGVDLIVVETMISLQEVRAAILGIRSVCDLPVLVSMTFEQNGKTLYGTDAVTALLCVQQMGADAFGTNCGNGPVQIKSIVEELDAYAKIPLIAKPNAGLPKVNADGTVSYDLDSRQFAAEMAHILDGGANLMGGCCGTTPEYIEAISTLKDRITKAHTERALYYTSERDHIAAAEADVSSVIPIAEYADEIDDLADEIYDVVMDAQEEEGDVILLGLDGLTQETVTSAVQALAQMPGNFLGFSCQEAALLETALMQYPGIAAYQNVSADPTLDAIAEKYGAIKLA